MKKKALWKDIWKEIWNNKARFLALFAIILLGVGFFGGIKATGPDMLQTANRYYQENNLFDLKVLSTMGIEEEDVAQMEEVGGVSVYPVRSLDLNVAGEEFLLRLFPYSDQLKEVNDYSVMEGRLPEQPGEIALDAQPGVARAFELGETIRFQHPDESAEAEAAGEADEEEWMDSGIHLKDRAYTVVGFVNSPLYIEQYTRGATQVGKGSLDGFGVVMEEDVEGTLYTEAYVRFEQEAFTSYTSEYEDHVNEKTEEVELALNGRPLERINEIRAEGKKQLFTAERELEDARQQLAEGEQELADARAELDSGIAAYNQQKQQMEEQLAAAEQELAQQQAKIDQGWQEYQAGLAAWEASARQYADAKAAWESQKASLLSQLGGEVSLEELAVNPPPGEAGQQLGQQAQSILDGEQAVATAQGHLEAYWDALQTREAELAKLEESLAADKAASQALTQQLEQQRQALTQAQQQPTAAREQQLAAIQAYLSEPFSGLSEERKEEMRAALAQQGEQSALYGLFLAYLEEAATVNQVQQQVNAEEAALAAIKQELADLQAAVSELESQLAALALETRQQEVLQQGIQLETEKQTIQNQIAALERRSQELARARNTLLREVRKSLQGVSSDIAAADNQFAQQGEQLVAARTELEKGRGELTAGQAELDAARSQLAAQRSEGEAALTEAWKQIQAGEQAYQDGLAEFEAQKRDAEEQLAEGEAELNRARTELLKLEEPVYFVQDRSVNPGYLEYRDNANRMSAIATIFPVFFFLIAALVSFTTITRMVEEQRMQMGTLKALGYGNWDIVKKYLVYALLAGVLGTVLGLLFGYHLFPTIIYNAYSSLYNLPDVEIRYYASYSWIAFLVAILCTVGPALFATATALREDPASLMRPKAPRKGKRVLMERIPFIWNRLGFNAKITVRNLVRYKIRNSMTVIGVAGCTILILTGFAVKNSISGLAETQFNDIMRYDAILSLNPDADEAEREALDERLAAYPEVEDSLYVLQDVYKAKKSGVNPQDVNLFVPETTEGLGEFVALQDRQAQEKYTLTDEGAIISEKLALLLGIGAGDVLELRDEEEAVYRIPVAAVTENYTGHYAYLTPELYEDIFADAYVPNSNLLNYDASKGWEDRFAEGVMEEPAVTLVTFLGSIDRAFSDTLASLDIITLVLIVSAAGLAFVVLYNLTNINVSERMRELSTIKVLGFYHLEVSMYIYRETFILTLLGILLGFPLGRLLSEVVLKMVEVDFMLFPITILPRSYLYSALLSMAFSLVVMIIMHFKLKRVDMVEALKSVE